MMLYHWIHTGNFGGLEKFVVNLHKSIRSKGKDSKVFFTKTDESVRKGIMGSGDQFMVDKTIFQTICDIRASKPDVLIHYTGATMHYAPIIKLLSPRTIQHRVFMHGFKSKKDIYHRWLYRFFTKNIFPTKLTLLEGKEQLPMKHETMFFQYFGVDSSFAPKERDVKAISSCEKVVLCSMSRIERLKGIYETVVGIGGFIMSNPEKGKRIEYNIFGAPHSHDEEGMRYNQKIKDYIADNGLGEQIKLCGMTDRPEEQLKRSHFLLFASYDEFYGFALIEALASGTPILSSHKGSFRELNDASCGYFVDFDSKESVNAILDKVTEMSDEAFAELSDGARTKYEKNFVISQTTDQFLSTI